MKTHRGARRRRPWLIGLAMVIATGVIASGCETIGGGESGAKHGPNTEHPNAKDGRGKFKSNCVTHNYTTEPDGGPTSAADAFDALIAKPRPLATEPDSNLLLNWGGGGSSGGGGGGHDKVPC